MTRPRGFADWNPQPAGFALIVAVKGVLRDYANYLPLTIRQIFYRLVVKHPDLVGKTEKDYKRLCEHLNRARRAGMISMEDIRDDGTTVKPGFNYDDEDDLVSSLKWYARHARLDLQVGQEERIELWCEAAGMVPQLEKVARPYGVTVVSSGGFDSVTGKYEQALRYAEMSNFAVRILHLGDYDPSGVHIFSSLAEDVEAFAMTLGNTDVTFERLLVLPEHIAPYNLPTAPPKKTDNRRFDDNRTVQAEAFDPATLAQIVEDAITSRLDMGVHATAVDEQREVRDRMANRITT